MPVGSGRPRAVSGLPEARETILKTAGIGSTSRVRHHNSAVRSRAWWRPEKSRSAVRREAHVPVLRQRSPEFSGHVALMIVGLEPRRRAEQALLAVVQEACVNGVSTRKVDRLVAD
ncbi:MAG: transposase, partial [Solirubrobacteraceae bacterium]